MKLGVSNLAWADADTDEALACLAAAGVAGIEVAPTRIAPWEDLNAAGVAQYRNKARAAGLQTPSLQAIFFGAPGAQLLGDPSAFGSMVEHMRLVAGIANDLEARVAVFGAPRNRNRGALSPDDAEAIAAERLRILGEIAYASGLVLGLEPVPSYYSSDFLMHASDVRRIVSLCGHPGVGCHLDSACVTLAGDAISEEVERTGVQLLHYHISEPGLGSFENPICPHGDAACALNAFAYERWLVIEMSAQVTGVAAIESAVAFAQRTYGVHAIAES